MHRRLRHCPCPWDLSETSFTTRQGDEGIGGIKGLTGIIPSIIRTYYPEGLGPFWNTLPHSTLPAPLFGTGRAPMQLSFTLCHPPPLPPASGKPQRLPHLPLFPSGNSRLNHRKLPTTDDFVPKNGNFIRFTSTLLPWPLWTSIWGGGQGEVSVEEAKGLPCLGPCHSTCLVIFSSSSSGSSSGRISHSSDLEVCLPLNTQSSSFTVSTSHFLERPQSEPHPLSWDTILPIPPLVGLAEGKWIWWLRPTCDGPLTLEQEGAQEHEWACTPFPTAGDTAEAPVPPHFWRPSSVSFLQFSPSNDC